MTMMDLPESVVFEIFMRLPVRSLLRFRSVCKDWFSLINSPVFKEKHLSYRIARDDESLILVDMSYDGRSGYLTCYSDYESSRARGLKASSYTIYTGGRRWWMHANGIICFVDNSETIYLLNPALREIRALPDAFPVTHPKSLPDHDYYVIKAGGFVSDDVFCERRRLLGFGYDDSTKDYIVVYILGDNIYDGHDKCVVYHVMTDCWMMVEMPEFMTPVSPYFGPCYSTIFSHGSIHWLIRLKLPNTIYRILTFNVANKLFQEIQFPHGMNNFYSSRDCPYLFKVDESCIALVVESCTWDRDEQEWGMDIWMMKEYGVTESWTKQYSISPYYYRPLCFLKADKLLLLTTEDRNRNNRMKMVCYHLSIGQTEDVWYQEYEGAGSYPCKVVTCYESLISINKSSKLEKTGQQSLQQVAGSVLEKDPALLIQEAGQQLESLSHKTEGLAEKVLAPRNSLYVTNESKKQAAHSPEHDAPQEEGKVEGNHVSPSLPPCKGVVEVTTDLLLSNSFEMLSMLPAG